MQKVVIWMMLLCKTVYSFMITIDAHETACFHDKALTKDKITIRFEVMEGGFKDIAIHITDPSGNTLFQSESETSGSYTFAASEKGKFKLCFDNERSTLTPKLLMFHFTVIHELSHYIDQNKRADDVIEQSVLQENINALSGQLMNIRHEQEYMHVRYSGHAQISKSVHFRIVAWSIFGPSLLLLMTIVEVYYLKRFFEVRRVV
ncbi:transmembrane emp24 domain-containing protein 2 [Drosophila albomicans]|uniref:Transmembrane emp24 domain-containing protein 2 n=1 Tax=Drosophila albomicans TaxID=7291 RepID=A0A6P8Y2A8_DROAB|nr:transmembrane emp24 domain-containing protein 2 [Drosophila albomicans]